MSIANTIWTVAIRTRNTLKRAGMLGPLDGLSTYLGPRLLPPPQRDVVVALPLDLELVVPAGYPSYRNFATGLYETDVTAVVRSRVLPGMTVVDLGASIGYYTLLASRLVGTTGRVYAFEPDLEAHSYLERNVARNESTNVAVVPKAVGDVAGVVGFARPGPERGFVAGARSSILVEAVTLDGFFEGIDWPRVDVIKIDVEGYEQRTLEGMRELLRRNPSIQLIVEVNVEAMARGGSTLTEFVETLVQLGFSSGYLIEQRRHVRLASLLPGSRAVHNLLLGGRAA